MDVVVTEDQLMLQDATRRFLEKRTPVEALRKCVESQQNYLPEIWREGLELGWIALFVPEELGGIAESANGVVDAAIIAEELGRVVYSGPFLANCVVAYAISSSASAGQQAKYLPDMLTGDVLASWCFAAPGPRGGAEPAGVTVKREKNGYVLDGVAANVQDAEKADLFLVTAMDDTGGVSQFLVPYDAMGITISSHDPLDLGRGLADVLFNSVAIGTDTLMGEYGVAAQSFEQQLQVALVLHSAESVGVTDRALEFTLDYVKQRYAFGRPIGSFQALKHRLANHSMQLEGGKAAVAHAASSVQAGAADAAVAASVAKAQTGKYGTEIVRDCLHMHGGIGMTWEHDIHFYLRRVVSNEALWGSPSVHYERLCQLAQL